MTASPDDEADKLVPVKEVPAGHHNEEETKKLNHRGPAAFTEAPAIVREAPPASPLRFYARLRHQLESRNIDYDALPRLTEPGQSPPCFRRLRVSFDSWLASASMLGATVPYRYGMPAEPNYCWDCTRQFQQVAQELGVCKFPGTRFEHSRTLSPDADGRRIPETEVLGIHRAPRLDASPSDVYDSSDTSEEIP
jgi:hypothetical protein